jgi:transcriptional regulator of nitric oxide reductase
MASRIDSERPIQIVSSSGFPSRPFSAPIYASTPVTQVHPSLLATSAVSHQRGSGLFGASVTHPEPHRGSQTCRGESIEWSDLIEDACISSTRMSRTVGMAYRMHVDWMAAMAAVLARHSVRCRPVVSEY